MRCVFAGAVLALGAGCGTASNSPCDACADVSSVDAATGVTAAGGVVPSLLFAVVGDTRPPNEDDTENYPTPIITQIFADIAAFTPAPQFVLATGDFMYANPSGSQASVQLQKYLNAQGRYTGPLFPALGNHECTGGTASNCGPGNVDGVTNNFSAFQAMMLAPIGQSLPYYVVHVASPTNAWTSKFVFVAANAWDSTQASWFDQAMQEPTTYTFIVRHESADANTAPGVSPSEAIMAKYPYTLAIVGHSHEYRHSSYAPKEVIIGNGGAPISTGQNYGYGIFTQRQDGTIQVDMLDYMSNAPDMSFRFAVHPDGSPA